MVRLSAFVFVKEVWASRWVHGCVSECWEGVMVGCPAHYGSSNGSAAQQHFTFGIASERCMRSMHGGLVEDPPGKVRGPGPGPRSVAKEGFN